MKNQTDNKTKPYNRCISCEHRGVHCDGPRTAGLSLQRWKEYMRDLKEILGITNAFIAERAELPVKTVEKALSPASDQDVMRETARRIENAIFGLTSQYPCYAAYEEEVRPAKKMQDAMLELERVLKDNGEYKKALDNIHVSYRYEMDTIRAEHRRTTDFLLGQIANAREDCVYWRDENTRKNRMIDAFMQNRTDWMRLEEAKDK